MAGQIERMSFVFVLQGPKGFSLAILHIKQNKMSFITYPLDMTGAPAALILQISMIPSGNVVSVIFTKTRYSCCTNFTIRYETLVVETPCPPPLTC